MEKKPWNFHLYELATLGMERYANYVADVAPYNKETMAHSYKNLQSYVRLNPVDWC